jgi:putative membrane protein
MFKKNKSHNGVDIDVRFLLANERTLLAWIRTGLTLIAGGVAVAFISADTKYGTIAGIGAITFGGLLALIGYIRYIITDRAIRRGVLPQTGVGGLLVVVGVVIFATLLVVVKNLGI